MKKAFITGITGQDGAYLSKWLLDNGYRVYGLCRPESKTNTWRLEYLQIREQVNFLSGELTDYDQMTEIIKTLQPDEIYNLAAQSSVQNSWQQPRTTAHINALGTVNLLEAARLFKPDARFFQASSADMFGSSRETVRSETSGFYPHSPYAAAKLYAHWMTISYREGFKLYACSGILFNHESPLRGTEFVSRKVTAGVARIKNGLLDKLRLGNIDAKRDWGHAKDYVQAMWLMLQQQIPEDYVLATGRTTTVREMCRIAFDYVGLKMDKYIEIDPALFRPVELEEIYGNPAKAKTLLGWEAKTTLEQLIQEMVAADLKRLAEK